MAESDRELLDAWRAGDSSAGNRLVRRHFRVVYRFFRNKLEQGVEELVQRTFLACVEHPERFRGDSTFRAYVLGIARKQLLRHLRDQRTAQARFDPGQSCVRDLSDSPSEVVAMHEEQRVLLCALRSIPIDLQIVVELYYWEDLPIAEIAAVTEVPPGTVKSRLSRARERLRGVIEAMDESPDLLDTTLQNLDHWARSLRQLVGDEPE